MTIMRSYYLISIFLTFYFKSLNGQPQLCSGGKKYEFFFFNANFSEAENNCAINGGTLASFDQIQFNALADLVTGFNIGEDVWVGITNVNQSEVTSIPADFAFVDGTTNSSFIQNAQIGEFPWADFQPNGTIETVEHCVVLDLTSGLLKDVDCVEARFGHICHFENSCEGIVSDFSFQCLSDDGYYGQNNQNLFAYIDIENDAFTSNNLCFEEFGGFLASFESENEFFNVLFESQNFYNNKSHWIGLFDSSVSLNISQYDFFDGSVGPGLDFLRSTTANDFPWNSDQPDFVENEICFSLNNLLQDDQCSKQQRSICKASFHPLCNQNSVDPGPLNGICVNEDEYFINFIGNATFSEAEIFCNQVSNGTFLGGFNNEAQFELFQSRLTGFLFDISAWVGYKSNANFTDPTSYFAINPENTQFIQGTFNSQSPPWDTLQPIVDTGLEQCTRFNTNSTLLSSVDCASTADFAVCVKPGSAFCEDGGGNFDTRPGQVSCLNDDAVFLFDSFTTFDSAQQLCENFFQNSGLMFIENFEALQLITDLTSQINGLPPAWVGHRASLNNTSIQATPLDFVSVHQNFTVLSFLQELEQGQFPWTSNPPQPDGIGELSFCAAAENGEIIDETCDIEIPFVCRSVGSCSNEFDPRAATCLGEQLVFVTPTLVFFNQTLPLCISTQGSSGIIMEILDQRTFNAAQQLLKQNEVSTLWTNIRKVGDNGTLSDFQYFNSSNSDTSFINTDVGEFPWASGHPDPLIGDCVILNRNSSLLESESCDNVHFTPCTSLSNIFCSGALDGDNENDNDDEVQGFCIDGDDFFPTFGNFDQLTAASLCGDAGGILAGFSSFEQFASVTQVLQGIPDSLWTGYQFTGGDATNPSDFIGTTENSTFFIQGTVSGQTPWRSTEPAGLNCVQVGIDGLLFSAVCNESANGALCMTPQNPSCGDEDFDANNFIFGQGECKGEDVFLYFDRLTSFDDAKENCFELFDSSGSLTHINDTDDLNSLVRLSNQFNLPGAWVGYEGDIELGSVITPSDFQLLSLNISFTDFVQAKEAGQFPWQNTPTEPNGDEGRSCAGVDDGLLFDDNCTSLRPFICRGISVCDPIEGPLSITCSDRKLVLVNPNLTIFEEIGEECVGSSSSSVIFEINSVQTLEAARRLLPQNNISTLWTNIRALEGNIGNSSAFSFFNSSTENNTFLSVGNGEFPWAPLEPISGNGDCVVVTVETGLFKTVFCDELHFVGCLENEFNQCTGLAGINITNGPTKSPTNSPVNTPIVVPTSSPINSPTASPLKSPTNAPIVFPTSSPTTKSPTASPLKSPTKSPTGSPIISSTNSPTGSPTRSPTFGPTLGSAEECTGRKFGIINPLRT